MIVTTFTFSLCSNKATRTEFIFVNLSIFQSQANVNAAMQAAQQATTQLVRET